jgi:hypothetical protein
MYGPLRICKQSFAYRRSSVAQMYPASRESAAFGDQAMMRIRAYRFHLLGAVSGETSFRARIYSTPIDRCAISKLRRKPEGRSSRKSRWRPPVSFCRVSQNFPGDTSDFVRQRNDDFVAMHSLFECGDPAAQRMLSTVAGLHAGPGTVNEQTPYVGIATLADP